MSLFNTPSFNLKGAGHMYTVPRFVTVSIGGKDVMYARSEFKTEQEWVNVVYTLRNMNAEELESMIKFNLIIAKGGK